ncbi:MULTISPECIES: PLDc N-terminal domain-containing protein [Lysinibacillus]|uniref:PLDc_N domain-containing protein n=1 Tax=Lysinibacillus antri TaxID=2498145 RepID=A0A3S0R425_9BACI|nr:MULTISPECIES: PLD nuclease N-terminal domain-containing protein [Lysinibacillus]RUL47796.1 PLDc_N domain-containing protein [Lysinibacillus antri]TSI08343.1 PLDc_N domain-containing protein [Lysinibacillus sp. BW-2-10]
MGELQSIPWALIAPLFIVQLILMIIALIDLSKIHATNGPKWLWVIVIIFGNLLGSIVYFIAGRKQS